MLTADQLEQLREVISENLRVQRNNNPVDYISVGTALQDAKSKQNHAIFARRGCGKTLLLHHSSQHLKSELKSIYLNCEDFKRHSFPNVLVEILASIFRELDKNISGWFGKKKKLKQIIKDILEKLRALHVEADNREEAIRSRVASEQNSGFDAGINIEDIALAATGGTRESHEVERSFKIHHQKLQELDRWLPNLKENLRELFEASSTVKGIILQIDDLYHLKRTDQAFVVDYVHRLCKDIPIYFKIATLRHSSTLYVDRDGQPIGAQERHDYQPIDIDYTFNNFARTLKQNHAILLQFGAQAGISEAQIMGLFKGEGFTRLVMAGGGVPRDVLSLFLHLLNETVQDEAGRIGKDEVRLLSRHNFERKIEELKQDSKDDEQDDLLKGIYIIKSFCLDKKNNIFVIEEKLLQQNDALRALIYRLLDYRIIHSCATALTHKSAEGTFQAFAVDIGCYAHYRKLDKRFNEIDVSDTAARERMRSAPVLDQAKINNIVASLPAHKPVELLAEAMED
ncbi:MAG: hypothetical protein LBE53_14620 [Paucimonas sp.]|uniref:hypothetical protein n=1 Tax=Pantoea sp. Cy-639 TaxID=2608360 RepID=UPI00142364AA|nr:hypothetical protein [Pantoea sp. Cy-639]MDR2308412.1 hypothetical protein [Paucimonas sp.]NIF15437.1 hypothetical protein [Pantoea sp. Cy-639]